MRKQAQVCKEKGIGIFALTLERRQANGKNSVDRARSSQAGKLSRHRVYHRDRDIVNPLCELCNPAIAFEVDDFAAEYDSQVRHKTIAVENCRCQGCITIKRREFTKRTPPGKSLNIS